LKGGNNLLLDIKRNTSVKLPELYNITEDAIALVTKLSANVNGESNIQEYNNYIDNVIHYFSDRQISILNLGRQQIDIIYSARRQILKNASKIKYPIKLNKPNFKYFKLPTIDKIMYDDFITKWNFDNNDKLYMYANIYSPVYNTITKQLTNDEIKNVKDINKLSEVMTESIIINNEQDLTDYLNNIIIPRDDLYNINKFIDSMIISLKDLKSKSVLDLTKDNIDFNNKIIFAMKMIDIKSMYVKNVVNILLDIYMIKINLCSYSGAYINITNQSINEMFINRSIYSESLVYLSEGFDEELYKKINNNSKDIQNSHLELNEEYIDRMFESLKNHMDKYYRYDALTGLNMFNNSSDMNVYIDVDNIIDYERFINDNKDGDFFLNRSMIFIDHNDCYDRRILLDKIDQKDKILNIITGNYNKIKCCISDMKDNQDSIIYSKNSEGLYKIMYLQAVYQKKDDDIFENIIRAQFIRV
jgi:hypothetical protein